MMSHRPVVRCCLIWMLGLVLAGSVWAEPKKRYGTGMSDFVHVVEETFDFHMAYPMKWEFRQYEGAQMRRERRWFVANENIIPDPSRKSWVDVRFLANFPAENREQLADEIERRHQADGIQWREINDNEFIGFTSGLIPDGRDATREIHYYLVRPNHVIRIDLRKDMYEEGAHKVDMILKTINRASTPPRIKSIRTLKAGNERYAVNEEACYEIMVDDFKGSFSTEGLKTFEVEGAPKHWSFKTHVKWDEEFGKFEICLNVTAAFSEADLMVRSLAVTNNQGRSVSCMHLSSGNLLRCHDYDVKAAISGVANSDPDKMGPEIGKFVLSNDREYLLITVSDPSGVRIGEVKMENDRSVLIYPDQFVNGGEVRVRLSSTLENGWNAVKSLILYDSNGMPSLLRMPSGGEELARYELVKADGTVSPTAFPIIKFLK